jgi:predicted dehydrogenase
MSKPLNWGILNTGRIASCFARNLVRSRTGNLLAVASRDAATARKFAADVDAARPYGNYEDLLGDKDIDAVYISPPHPFHADYAIKALAAKKNVLLEKPLAINHGEAERIIDAARTSDVLLMEAFMYRCHPQTNRLIELLRAGTIGEIRSIRASFGYNTPFDANSRVFRNALAGGGILDVGCYCVSMSRLIAGVSRERDFAEPLHISGAGHLGTTGVDEWAFALMTFSGDIIAQLATSVRLNQDNDVVIDGSKGRIRLPNPWVYSQEKPEDGKIVVMLNGQSETQINIEATVTSYTYEADVFGDAVLAGKKQAPFPAMTWDDSVGNMKTLDRWRQSIGMTYNPEKGI